MHENATMRLIPFVLILKRAKYEEIKILNKERNKRRGKLKNHYVKKKPLLDWVNFVNHKRW